MGFGGLGEGFRLDLELTFGLPMATARPRRPALGGRRCKIAANTITKVTNTAPAATVTTRSAPIRSNCCCHGLMRTVPLYNSESTWIVTQSCSALLSLQKNVCPRSRVAQGIHRSDSRRDVRDLETDTFELRTSSSDSPRLRFCCDAPIERTIGTFLFSVRCCPQTDR